MYCLYVARYIKPEYIPIQYGGLSRHGELNNGLVLKPASEFMIKGGEKVHIPFERIEVIYIPPLLNFYVIQIVVTYKS